MKKKIFIGPSTFGAVDPSPLKKLSGEGFESVNNPFGRKVTKKELLEFIPGVTGLIAGLEILDREVMENSRLKVISRCGSGTDNIDLKAASELGIKVYSTADAPVEAVAELTMGAMFSLLRSIPQMDKDLHCGKWTKKTGSQLKAKTVAIIGYGRIGRYVAKLLKPFEVIIIIVDPNINPDDLKLEGIELMSLDKAISIADIVTIHVNENNEIFGEKEFELMKKGAFLLNSSRGSVINESALAFAIENRKLAGAWLDTFKEEPYSGPLIKYDNIILTPHVGSYTRECRQRMEMEAVDNLLAGFKDLEE